MLTISLSNILPSENSVNTFNPKSCLASQVFTVTQGMRESTYCLSYSVDFSTDYSDSMGKTFISFHILEKHSVNLGESTRIHFSWVDDIHMSTPKFPYLPIPEGGLSFSALVFGLPSPDNQDWTVDL